MATTETRPREAADLRQAAEHRDARALAPKRVRPIVWWASAGAGFLAFAAYLVAKWLINGEAHRVSSGVTSVPDWMKISLSIQQWGLATIAVALIYFKTIRPRMRTGSFTFDGLLIISFALMWWSDPIYNYFQHGFNYNAYFVNLGSWASGIPGWQSPHGEQIPQPLIWLPGVYVCAFFLMVIIATAILRKCRATWPRMSLPAMWTITFFPMMVAGTLWEAAFMRLGSHHYGGAIEGLTLSLGHYYAFPVYQGITASILYTTWASMRFFKDDKGRSFAEKGIDELRVGSRAKGWIRFLAVSGATTMIFFLGYHLPNNYFALKSSSWPQDVQKRSYFTSGLCGEGTDVACPGPDVPIARGNSSLRVGPDGRLIVPEGATVPNAPPFDTSP